MDNCPTNGKKVNSNRLTINYKFTKNFNTCCSDNIDKPHDKSNYDKNSVNLFQDIVKLGTIKSSKENNNIPFNKCKSINHSQNIFEFTESLYNDEEHFYKNQIYSCKNSENDSPNNNVHSPRARQSSFSNKKNSSSIKKGINKKGAGGLLGFSLKRKSKRVSIIKLRSGELNSHKSNNNFAFFFKLKEKDKIPSKTPYLDKKHWNSTYNIQKFEFNNKVGNSITFKKKNSSNVSLVRQSVLSKEKIDEDKKDYTEIYQDKNDSIKKTIHHDNHDNVDLNEDKKKEKIKINKGSINDAIIYRKEVDEIKNHDINDNNKNINNNINSNIFNIFNKKEIIKIDNNSNHNTNHNLNENNDAEKRNKNLIPEKNNNNNKSNIIFNILNKPFFCCLKS